MARPQRFLVDPNNPQSIVEQSTEHTKVLDGEISFGDPSDPTDLDSTTLPGSSAAAHPGVLQNVEGSWAEQDVTGLNTPVMFYHNLDAPVSTALGGLLNQPNVRMLHFMWDHSGNAQIPSLSVGAGTVWKLIRSYAVTGSALGSITFTGLDGNTDEYYRITTEIVTNSANTVLFLMQANSSTTTYQTQRAHNVGAGVFLASAATNGFEFGLKLGGGSGTKLTGELLLFANADGHYRESIGQYVSAQAGMSFATNASHWTNTATNITSLKFLDSGAGTEFGVGTKIEIWAPQPFSVAASSMTDDATVSYCFDRRDQALVTADAVPLRFYAAGNRRVDGDNPIRATFFFIPAIR